MASAASLPAEVGAKVRRSGPVALPGTRPRAIGSINRRPTWPVSRSWPLEHRAGARW